MRSGCAPRKEFRRRSPHGHVAPVPIDKFKASDRCAVPDFAGAPFTVPVPGRVTGRLLRDPIPSAACSASTRPAVSR
jgi:hypothetical protein